MFGSLFGSSESSHDEAQSVLPGRLRCYSAARDGQWGSLTACTVCGASPAEGSGETVESQDGEMKTAEEMLGGVI